MAIIRCINCNENYSDTIVKCLHCGYEAFAFVCPECGSIVNKEWDSCYNCGYILRNSKLVPATLMQIENEYKEFQKIEFPSELKELQKLRKRINQLNKCKDISTIIDKCDKAISTEEIRIHIIL